MLVLTQGLQKDAKTGKQLTRDWTSTIVPGLVTLGSSVQQNLQRSAMFVLGRRMGYHDILLLMALAGEPEYKASWGLPNPTHELPS